MFNSECIVSFFFMFLHHNHILLILRWKNMFEENLFMPDMLNFFVSGL